ncbi:amidohydrolase [Halomonas sp. V046]|uniref:amidohydrolase n=1 Tax=Halomonas sp. V046 TaxID=3459611 RepID=UPI004043EF8D
MFNALALTAATLVAGATQALDVSASTDAPATIDTALEQRVIDWRRDIHQHPELANQETRTAAVVADHLRSLGMQVRTGVAETGIVAFLQGGQPGPTIALRADMDALPVVEQVDLPFASRTTATYNGKEVGVMHACGHDNHVAMLMGAAEALTARKDELKGSILFIFQPAEEGVFDAESWGAKQMLAEGAFDEHPPQAVFGIHVTSGLHTGQLGYLAGPILASSDTFTIRVHGSQTHGAVPWNGVDPIVIGSQIVTNAQSIISRQVNITEAPSVLTFGIFDGGVRENIIPEGVTLKGTLRNFDMDVRDQVFASLSRMATATAEANGGSAESELTPGYPVTVNDPQLVETMLPTARRVAGADNVVEQGRRTAAEDFAYYAQEVPGMFVSLGITPPDQDLAEGAPNHSPRFRVDEDALKVGTELFINLALDYAETREQ